MNDMSAKRFASVEEWDLDALRHAVRRGGPATPDDVSITMDGRRLDSREAVLTFLTTVESERPIEARMTAAGATPFVSTRPASWSDEIIASEQVAARAKDYEALPELRALAERRRDG